MTITVVRDIDSFRALKDEWNALLENSSNNTLFLCWEWMFHYYTHMCEDQELFLLLVRNDKGELKGIAPFILREERIITKKIFLELIAQRYSYYVGIISNNDNREDVYREIFGYLFANRKSWDLINIIHLSNHEKFKMHLKNHSKEYGYLCRETIKDPCKVVRLTRSFNEYMSSLSKDISKKVKYYLRSINRDFGVEVSLPDDEVSLLASWRKFLELHESRVHSKGGKTVLSNKAFQDFYYSIAHAAYQEGNLRLTALKLDDEIAAVLFGIVWNKTFYFLNIGYREFSKYSLGLVLPVLCIEKSIESGLEYFDFMGGGGDYKEKLGGVDKGGLNIQVVKRITRLEVMAKTVAKKVLKKGMISRTKKVGFL